ncbi:GNAT family N-acetyltransferase [Archangium lansingense]|uniref:GNAT family N-acetyltransferase n=1 Tax=Archangium lansingense TaxID=2995310 RepID=A0ABT3ZV56_9BACT|nr:GNAT family N-acetyltransferase [Archangium lansinium]MCY1073289.1 GNAT family N-acetyltransferase [Archangium lansinium]
MEAGWSIRKAGVEDLEDLVRLRLELLRSTRGVERLENEETLVDLTRRYLERAITAGRFHTWVAEAGGRLVACGGVMPFERPPVPGNMAGLEMHILNMYTEPGWRGRGVARALFSELMRFAREQGAGRICLHASAEGRPLYESVGFQPNPTALEWTPSSK